MTDDLMQRLRDAHQWQGDAPNMCLEAATRIADLERQLANAKDDAVALHNAISSREETIEELYEAGNTLRAQLAALRDVPEDLVEAARKAVTDECGSQLCVWTDNGTKRVCRSEFWSSTVCLCERVANAATEAIAPAIRAAERDRRAKVCEARHDEHRRHASVYRSAKNAEHWKDDADFLDGLATEAADCATAIRSGEA